MWLFVWIWIACCLLVVVDDVDLYFMRPYLMYQVKDQSDRSCLYHVLLLADLFHNNNNILLSRPDPRADILKVSFSDY